MPRGETPLKKRILEENPLKRRIFEIIEIGYGEDAVSRGYDLFSTLIVVVNLTAIVLSTFDSYRASIGWLLEALEGLTALFFAVDYILRVWTACYLYQEESPGKATLKYVLSFTGIIDLLSFLPYFLPVFFPEGAVAFRMFRVIRILRLFRINTYYDSLNVITGVIAAKRQQLISSVFIIMILMLAASLCMYSIEHTVQPEVFQNAFSGIWWAASTLLTVGYGDIYPITTLGKIFSIFITFLGVGMVAIPTGIISAGFVEQYTHLKRISEQAEEEKIRFVQVVIDRKDEWNGQRIEALQLPRDLIIAAVMRDQEVLVPRGDLMLQEGDAVILGAAGKGRPRGLSLKELTLKEKSSWNGQKIRDLDISRQTIIVMVHRGRKALVPKGDLVLHSGDRVVLYSKVQVPGAEEVLL